MTRRAAFWYPSLVVGGAESLLVGLITTLTGSGIDCRLWDFADGHMTAALRRDGVAFGHVPCAELGLPPAGALADFGPEDILVVFHTHLFKLPLLPRSRCKVLVWEVHNAFWLPEKSAARHRLKLALCGRLLARGALATIEPESFEMMRRAGLDGSPPPRIAVSVAPAKEPRTARTTPPALFAGMGRASPDKIVGPAWAFGEIARLRPEAAFEYLCDDPERARALFGKFAPEIAGRISLPAGRTGAAAQRRLADTADVFLGMGASALDAAKNGVPTIIVDSCESKTYPAGARVRLLWENAGYNTVSANPSTEHGRTLAEALAIIAADPAGAARKSLAYVTENHSPASTASDFFAAWSGDTLPLDEFVADEAFQKFAAAEHARMRRQRFRRALKKRLRALFGRSDKR